MRYDATAGDLVANGREGFRIWHRLFELVYARRGAEWLAVVEPVVDKLEEMYQVKKPSIYQSSLVDTSKQLTILDQERERLEMAVKQLETEKQATFDRLMKDPLTGLYNELYLLGMLEARIETRKQHPANEPFLLVYVAVDRLFRINRKYSYEIGDETIRLFADLLTTVHGNDARVFKASGAAIALLFEQPVAKERFERLLATIRESTNFVEPITASLAVVSSEDVNLEQDVKDIAQQMIVLAENRIQVAYQKGGNRIVDKDTPAETHSRGKILLIDILSNHRQMIFNAKYKQVGMIAMPYFFLFEMLGPLLELQGYAAIILGLVFGLLSAEIVLMLLIVNVFVGMVLSLFALLVEEHDIPYLPKRDTFSLIWTAILESLGWRQLIGVYRAISFFSALKENQEWGSMTRVGFQAKQTQPAQKPPGTR